MKVLAIGLLLTTAAWTHHAFSAEFDENKPVKLQGTAVNLYLPKFKMTAQFNLKKELSAMGMGVAFSNNADFSGMTSREKLKIDWDYGPNAGYDTTAYRAELEATAKRPGRLVRGQGDVADALHSAAHRVAAKRERTAPRPTSRRDQ